MGRDVVVYQDNIVRLGGRHAFVDGPGKAQVLGVLKIFNLGVVFFGEGMSAVIGTVINDDDAATEGVSNNIGQVLLEQFEAFEAGNDDVGGRFHDGRLMMA